MITFFIPGIPVAKARARYSSRSGLFYTPEKTRDWESYLRNQISDHAPDLPSLKPIRCLFTFVMPKPKNWKEQNWHIKKPDADNLVKSVKDAMNGIMYRDDSQLCEYSVSKIYGDKPGVLIVFEEKNSL